VYDLADRYVESVAALDPIRATAMGVAGHDDRLTDTALRGSMPRLDQVAVALALEPATTTVAAVHRSAGSGRRGDRQGPAGRRADST
jgi:hypothetical protein